MPCLLLIVLMAALAGCAMTPPLTPATPAGQFYQVETANVVSVRPVTVRQPSRGWGTVIGALTGGLAGQVLSGGRGANGTLATLGGAALGGVGGYTLEASTAQANAWELILKRPSGQELAILQPLEAGVTFRPGTTVRVLWDAQGHPRVVPLAGQ